MTGYSTRLQNGSDGSFDGFVKLLPGENRIRVAARSEDGSERTAERSVWFESSEPADAREAEIRRYGDPIRLMIGFRLPVRVFSHSSTVVTRNATPASR